MISIQRLHHETALAVVKSHEIVQLVFAYTRRTYQVPHLATKFVVFVVRIHQFHVGHMRSKCR